jgi:hypothetical protein
MSDVPSSERQKRTFAAALMVDTGPMSDNPEHDFWWRLVRLQPFGSDGSWRFEHPYLFTTLVLVGVPLAPLGVNWLGPPDAHVSWLVVVLLCAGWAAGLWAAVRLDHRLTNRSPRSWRYLGRHDASSSEDTRHKR